MRSRLQCYLRWLYSGLSTSKLMSPAKVYPGARAFKWGYCFSPGRELVLWRHWLISQKKELLRSKSWFGLLSCPLPCDLALSSWSASFLCHTFTHSFLPWWSKGSLPDAGNMPCGTSSHKSYKPSTLFFKHPSDQFRAAWNRLTTSSMSLQSLKDFNNPALLQVLCCFFLPSFPSWTILVMLI